MWRKLGLKSMMWTRRKKEIPNQKRMKKQFGKMRRGLEPPGHLETFQHLNYRGARRRGRTKKWKLIWTNNEGELPQSGKGNRPPGNPGSWVPKKLDPRRNTPKHTIITLAKIKKKERILEAAREKDTVTYKGVPISWFLKRDLTGKKGLARSIPSHERQGPTSKITLSSKAII